jgi:hypothetical protein
VNAGHDVRSLSLPGGLSAGEVAILGPVGDPPAVANPDRLQPRRVGDKAGPLKDNDVGYLNGQIWTYPVPKKEEGGPVKILFSVVEGAERIYYVGGDRRTPKELFRVSGDIEEPHIVATGKGLNQFYWQYWILYPLLPIGEQFARVIDSRVGDPINTPPLYELRNTQTAGLNQLYRTLHYDPIKYVGNGLITGFIYNSIDSPPESAVRTSAISFRGLEVSQGSIRVSTSGSGAGSGSRISGTPFTAWDGSVLYEFLATGDTPYFSGIGAEGGQSSSLSTVPGTYTADMSRRTLIHVGASASLMQLIEYQESGGVVDYKDRTISKVSGTERELSTEVKDLILDNWIGPSYSSIVGSTLWVIDPQLSALRTQLNNDQSFIDFKAIDLSSDDISNKRVKIFPISQEIDQIHSISYHP